MTPARHAIVSTLLCAFTIPFAYAQDADDGAATPLRVRGLQVLDVPAEHATIQDAIDAARDGEIVRVADGVYAGPGNRDLDFHGKAITVRSANGPAACVIDCNASQTDPHRGVVFQSGEGSDSVFEGFTICNGSTPQGAILDEFNGAGVLCTQGSSPTIRNCKITGNWAGCWGAAVCCSFGSSPTIENCVITDNFADDDGGGVFSWNNSHPTIINSIIAGNEARVTGGAISMFSTGMTIINTTIVDNVAPHGAAIMGYPTVINSILWNNSGTTALSGVPIITYSLVEGGYDGVGNLDVDPVFVDAAAGDYHLRVDSPLVDAGDPAGLPLLDETDIDGQPRLEGVAIDIGADEVMLSDIYGIPQPKPGR